jgi:hypothetical protein
MVFFDLLIRSRWFLRLDGEPSHYITEYNVAVLCTGNDDKPRRVGKARVYRINADRAADEGQSLFQVCDDYSRDLHECHTLLYEPDGYDFREVIMDEFHAVRANCLLLDYLVLAPKWRGLKLGLLVTRRIVDELGGGCGLVASKICTLSKSAPKMLGFPATWLPTSAPGAQVKLRRHFKQMGFRRIGRTEYYGLSLLQASPNARELLEPTAR